MRVVLPRLGREHDDAELLVQLARERGDDGLAGFELAARELPPARIDLARRPRREQEPSRGIDQHADRDVDDVAVGARVAQAWRPA